MKKALFLIGGIALGFLATSAGRAGPSVTDDRSRDDDRVNQTSWQVYVADERGNRLPVEILLKGRLSRQQLEALGRALQTLANQHAAQEAGRPSSQSWFLNN